MAIGTSDGTYHEDEFAYVIDQISKTGMRPVEDDSIGKLIEQDQGDPIGRLIEDLTQPKKDPRTGEKFFNDTPTPGEKIKRDLEGGATKKSLKDWEGSFEYNLKRYDNNWELYDRGKKPKDI